MFNVKYGSTYFSKLHNILLIDDFAEFFNDLVTYLSPQLILKYVRAKTLIPCF